MTSMLSTLSAQLDDYITNLSLAFPPSGSTSPLSSTIFTCVVSSSFADLIALWVSSFFLPVFRWDSVLSTAVLCRTSWYNHFPTSTMAVTQDISFLSTCHRFPASPKLGYVVCHRLPVPHILSCSCGLLVFCFKKKDMDSLCSNHRILAHGHLIYFLNVTE